MKQVNGWMFNLAAVVSFGTFVAAIVLLIRSCITADFCGITIGGTTSGMTVRQWVYTAQWGRGVVLLGVDQYKHTASDANELAAIRQAWERSAYWQHTELPKAKPPRQDYQFLDFGFTCRDDPVKDMAVRIRFPLWFVLLLISLLFRWLKKYDKVKRNAGPYACAVCGYDLRATPDRCPECGTVPTAHRA